MVFVVEIDPFQAPGVGAVPAGGHLHDQAPAGEGPGEHDGIHGGQGAAGGEAQLLRVERRAQQFGGLDLQSLCVAVLQTLATIVERV